MKKIIILVPSLIEGSGGHRTILNHAGALLQAGYDVHLALEELPLLCRDARALLLRLFGMEFESISTGWDQLPPADMIIATTWPSAYSAARSSIEKKLYFVQDFEAGFAGRGSQYLAAENSLRLGLQPVSIGRWLAGLIQQQYGSTAGHFDFGADLSCYHPPVPEQRDANCIVFIYQPDKPRRCAELGLQALAQLRQQRPEVRIQVYGSRLPVPAWLPCEHLGLLSPAACAELYRHAALGLCLSASNPSRVPFEMMACGLPVVELYGENTVYDLPDDGCLLCQPTPESLAAGMMQLLDQAQLRKQLSEGGAAFMLQRPLQQEQQGFVQWVAYLFQHANPAAQLLEPIYRRPSLSSPFRLMPAAAPARAARFRRRVLQVVRQLGKLVLSRLDG